MARYDAQEEQIKMQMRCLYEKRKHLENGWEGGGGKGDKGGYSAGTEQHVGKPGRGLEKV
jgi:hypothetical protein